MQIDSTCHIENLIERMSLEEKIGQLTLAVAQQTKDGPRMPEDCLAAVRAGRLGTLSHLWGREQTDEAQRIAVEESRLGIPLLFGADVLHGHRTIFPIPLAQAATFDAALWERTVARPVLDLKGVRKIALAPGASGTVTFSVQPDAFEFLDANLAPRVELGVFEILLGPSSSAASLLKTDVRLLAISENCQVARMAQEG